MKHWDKVDQNVHDFMEWITYNDPNNLLKSDHLQIPKKSLGLMGMFDESADELPIVLDKEFAELFSRYF